MSRYLLTQDQLDRMQEQIQELRRINTLKDERIRELELHKLRVSTSDVSELLKTIATLEEDVLDLQKANRRLTAEKENIKGHATRMRELEVLLVEERKLREYAEAFAEHLEQIHNEEVLLRNLTTELCELQKAEIDIDNKRIEELQRKVEKYSKETENLHVTSEKNIKQIASSQGRESIMKSSQEKENLEKNMVELENITKNAQGKENLLKNKQLKSVVLSLRKQLVSMHAEIDRKPLKTESDKRRLNDLNRWFQETDFVLDDVNNIEELRKDLNYLRSEIENRRKSIIKFRS